MNTFVTTLNLLNIAGIILLLFQHNKEILQKAVREDSFYLIFVAAIVGTEHLIYAMLEGIHPLPIFILLGYFLVPAFLLMIAQAKKKELGSWEDFSSTIVMFGIPMILGKKFGGSHELPFFITAAILNCLTLFLARGLEIKWQLHLHWQDLALTIPATIGTIVSLAVIGESIGFIAPRNALSNFNYLIQAITNTRFLSLLVYKAGVVALGEEIIFRGVTQTLIDERAGQLSSWLIASILFGLSHYSQGGQIFNFGYVLMAALAGLAYGWIFMSTKSIIWPICMHACIDAFVRTVYVFIPH